MTTSTSKPAQDTTPEFEAFWQSLNAPQPVSNGPRLIASGPSFEINLPLPPFGPHRDEQK